VSRKGFGKAANITAHSGAGTGKARTHSRKSKGSEVQKCGPSGGTAGGEKGHRGEEWKEI